MSMVSESIDATAGQDRYAYKSVVCFILIYDSTLYDGRCKN